MPNIGLHSDSSLMNVVKLTPGSRKLVMRELARYETYGWDLVKRQQV